MQGFGGTSGRNCLEEMAAWTHQLTEGDRVGTVTRDGAALKRPYKSSEFVEVRLSSHSQTLANSVVKKTASSGDKPGSRREAYFRDDL